MFANPRFSCAKMVGGTILTDAGDIFSKLLQVSCVDAPDIACRLLTLTGTNYMLERRNKRLHVRINSSPAAMARVRYAREADYDVHKLSRWLSDIRYASSDGPWFNQSLTGT
jgi:hypothetical protein